MKIGFVRRGFSPSGGAESYLNRLARGMTNAGHDAGLFTTDVAGSQGGPGDRYDGLRASTDRFC